MLTCKLNTGHHKNKETLFIPLEVYTMANAISGIHHVTAITDDPQRNLDFYTGLLGLRFVKKTVNFDSPETHHLYYGDEVGYPGTIMTFFSWPGYPRGRRGTGQVATTSFAIPAQALDYWQERLRAHHIAFEGPAQRFEEQVLSFEDPNGLQLELVAAPGIEQREIYWKQGPVPAEQAIRGFYGVTLAVARYESSAKLLTQAMGFKLQQQEGQRTRFVAAQSGNASIVDLLDLPGQVRGQEAVGSVHHVAFRAANDEEQLQWRQALTDEGMQVTQVLDRNYFHSIYFREPSGVLFEIATDQPGFPVDEPVAELGTHLKLPTWLESNRPELEKALPTLTIPWTGTETR
ncbi:Glyoxalase/bleomycin resistance protein/dioxygenase [Ktedonobacter racemifer DSM 44963]|uniref:Glyoxalase/bleomycin resistance protein/dioxygenase n=2 Tax=Ktedonobacter racemifer TaxID=363277 RepID=D6TR58_KTERA|nr:Glyoxalase/bleomycin resistance protein/dioxygenase [Ktedonobacter racemifer DSM 44963]